MMLQGAIRAEGHVSLWMNVPRTRLLAVLDILPAIQKPTVSPLSDEDWFSVSTIVKTEVARDLIPRLKDAGANGIIELPISKIVD